VWESARPDSVGFARFSGIFEAVVSEGTATAEFFSKEDGLFSLSADRDILGEEQDGGQRAWCGR